MLKCVEKTYKLEIDGGYDKKKCLTYDSFRYKEKALIDINKNYKEPDCFEYTWETLPYKTVVSSKENVYYKSRALYYEAWFTDLCNGDDLGIYPVRKLKQIDCPNAKFKLTIYYKILNDSDFTFKEIIEKEPADKVAQFLKEKAIDASDALTKLYIEKMRINIINKK